MERGWVTSAIHGENNFNLVMHTGDSFVHVNDGYACNTQLFKYRRDPGQNDGGSLTECLCDKYRSRYSIPPSNISMGIIRYTLKSNHNSGRHESSTASLQSSGRGR